MINILKHLFAYCFLLIGSWVLLQCGISIAYSVEDTWFTLLGYVIAIAGPVIWMEVGCNIVKRYFGD